MIMEPDSTTIFLINLWPIFSEYRILSSVGWQKDHFSSEEQSIKDLDQKAFLKLENWYSEEEDEIQGWNTCNTSDEIL